MKSNPVITGPLPDTLVSRARGRLARRLHRDGLADLFGPEPTPMSTAVIAQLLGVSPRMAKRLVTDPKPAPEPAPAT